MSRVEGALRRGREAAGEDPSEIGVDTDLVSRSGDSLDWFARVNPERRTTAGPTLLDEPAESIGVLQRADPESLEKLVISQGNQRYVEQYRQLAAVIHRTQAERSLKSLLVTSTLAGEGKTLSIANLALTLSESYKKRVLLIDADLRRPMLCRLFGVQPSSALAELLKQPASTAIEPVQVSELLYLLGAVAPDADPMGVLASPGMRTVVQQATETYDWVLVDSPPVALLPDANLLASIVDAVILVVQAGLAPYNAIQGSIDALGRERIMGVILNHAEPSALQGGFDAYYYGFSRNGSGR